ncbi:imidazole glycerol phosphate synthase subunit HisF [Flocculibacter collagenilyticus]|uniref:imidazole glycerol phosphate synthase subunit HisF n=1 Tax=Flocculibacter collagenilyticus TaxID=2744479 RepID=UPI0018F7598A|nr:imidazole glycerol phosphate synthase subunit HisF [Flocculibacter collagenilyticus]
MLAKRIIPCLDVRDGKVVKGVQFRNHEIIGDIVPLAKRYAESGADELVFYDITASSDGRVVDKSWVSKIAEVIDIPFCVAGGIKTAFDAQQVLKMGADKVSINSPALQDPSLIQRLSDQFGQQCVVVGIDSFFNKEENCYQVYMYTGDETKTQATTWNTMAWIKKVQQLGAGEIVLNCMNQDGVRQGYDITQLALAREVCDIPLIASGGAGGVAHFTSVFQQADVDGALAASVFHKGIIDIGTLKNALIEQHVPIRPMLHSSAPSSQKLGGNTICS